MKLTWYFINKGVPNISQMGFCVTAFTKKEAIQILEEKYSLSNTFDINNDINELNSLDELEQNHIKLNIGNPMEKGVWFPAF